MKIRFNIIVIIFITLIAIFIQLSRSDYLITMISNGNQVIEEKRKTSANLNNIDLSELQEEYCIMFDSNETSSLHIKNNIEILFKFIKKKYVLFDVSSGELLKYSDKKILITLNDLSKIDINNLRSYILKGGNVLFMQTIDRNDSFIDFYKELGIDEVYNRTAVKDIFFTENILINSKGKYFKGDFLNSLSFNLKLNKQCNVYAKNKNDLPLIWSKNMGNGKVFVFNTTLLRNKENIGLMLGIISYMDDVFVYPILNSKMVYIDNFPMYIKNLENNKLLEKYERKNNNFIKDIWWPNLLNLSSLYDLKYTLAFIESYKHYERDNLVFKNNHFRNNLFYYGSTIIKYKGELALNGYNKTLIWKNKNDIFESLNSSIKYIKNIYNSYEIKCYVPYMNILDYEIREELKSKIPEINVISSVFTDNSAENLYTQNFEIAKDSITEMPRISKGYENDDETIWNYMNGISSMGIFSHYIDSQNYNSDDYEEWENIYKKFEILLEEIDINYSWLKSKKASESAIDLKNLVNTNMYLKNEENNINIYCENFVKNTEFIIKTDEKVKKINGCEILKKENGFYVISAKKPHIVIEMEEDNK